MVMTVQKIEIADLQHYLDHLSSVLPAEVVEIEVVGLDVGDQLESSGLKLSGISYDPKDDAVSVDLDDKAQHRIAAPQEVYVDEGDDGLRSIEISCGKGHKHIIKIKA